MLFLSISAKAPIKVRKNLPAGVQSTGSHKDIRTTQ
jgi:hypothetical protein